jgi:two-component system chemotaxis sensor kinase CheA
MSSDMGQYRDLFVETAKKYLVTLNDELLNLEKKPDDEQSVDAIFRAAHSLKGQSSAMGYDKTGYLCHVIEDVFFEVKEKRRKMDPTLADLLFKSLDTLTKSIDHIESDGTEIDVSDIIDELKKITGLKTEGAGKSIRTTSTNTIDTNSNNTTDPKEVAKKAEDKNKVSEKKPDLKTQPEDPSATLSIKTIPVKVEQLDDIVGSIEELMVYRLTMQAQLKKTGLNELSQIQDKINKLIELIQFQVMKIRTVPLSMVFEHFPRAVRDLGRTLNKQIDFQTHGGELELDRIIVERLDEPLTHLIRNAADHGIGSSGTITLSAHADRDFAIVEVSDDGNGVDWDAVAKKAGVDPRDEKAVKKALFSGISTSSEVSLISGRGVGLEVVKKTVEDFGGEIDVTSQSGKGTTFTIKLPLTVSVARALIVEVNNQHYAIAASEVETSLRIDSLEIVNSAGQEAFRYQDQEIPIVRLSNIFNKSDNSDKDNAYIVILKFDDDKIGLAVDNITETLEAVIKPLPQLLKGLNMFSGVTIVGDGRSVLMINPRGIIE